MCNMKKNYVKPCMETIITEIRKNLLESSYIDIGGKTDTFDVRESNSNDIWGEEEE